DCSSRDHREQILEARAADADNLFSGEHARLGILVPLEGNESHVSLVLYHWHWLMNEIEKLFSLRDKIAVVLGGTSGIGQAIARGFAQGGATVIASSRDSGRVEAMAAELEALGSKTLRITSDVQNRASLET